MTLTFLQLRKQNLLRVCLDPARGAEEVLYLAAGDKPRTITVRVLPIANNLREDQAEVRTIDEIDVRVAKDPAATDRGRAIGGIAEPTMGDALRRPMDQPGQEYSFAYKDGSKETDDSWCLRFQRQRREQFGTVNMRR